MLNSREGRVIVELNYPHIIGISGYERHHDVATCSGQIRLKSSQTDAVMPATNTGLLAPIVPNKAFQNPSVPKLRRSNSHPLKLTANHGEARAGTGSKS